MCEILKQIILNIYKKSNKLNNFKVSKSYSFADKHLRVEAYTMYICIMTTRLRSTYFYKSIIKMRTRLQLQAPNLYCMLQLRTVDSFCSSSSKCLALKILLILSASFIQNSSLIGIKIIS